MSETPDTPPKPNITEVKIPIAAIPPDLAQALNRVQLAIPKFEASTDVKSSVLNARHLATIASSSARVFRNYPGKLQTEQKAVAEDLLVVSAMAEQLGTTIANNADGSETSINTRTEALKQLAQTTKSLGVSWRTYLLAIADTLKSTG